MSCGTCAERTRQGAAAASGSPRATGAAAALAARSGESEARAGVSRAARQRLWEQTAACPQCGAFASRAASEPCPLCHDTGQVEWDGETSSPQDLRARVLAQARQGADSHDGYVWAACLFPDLAQDPDVRARLRAEVEQHPTWALWGRAPDVLVGAGLAEIVAVAARQRPDAARVSLRAAAALAEVDKVI